MTAAYTDDATITQEQKIEKRTTASVARTSLPADKERVPREDDTTTTITTTTIIESNHPEESVIMSKVATGGQGSKEIVDVRERTDGLLYESPNSSTSSETSVDSKARKEPEFPQSGEIVEARQRNRSPVKVSYVSHEAGLATENKFTLDEAQTDRSDLPAAWKPVRSSSVSINIDGDYARCNSPESSACCARDSTSPLSISAENLRSTLNVTNDSLQLQELQRSINDIDEDATSSGNCEIYERSDLTLHDFNNESYDPESELDFYEAVRAGDSKCVATLLANGSVQNLDEPDWNVSGDPPLLVAATNHCLPVLSTLLANGCDPAVRSPRGETALHRVILNGGPGNVLKFVGELLKYGCPPGVKEAGGGLTALHVLTRQLAHAQGSKNLHHNFEAALKTLDLLAKAGPVNAKDHQGRSALHILASSTIFDNNHRTEIESLIGTLLAAGADPALKNDRGETPLHECLECGALNTAFLLVPHTPTGITSRYGETPLHIASRKNYVEMVAKLLEHGEDPSVQDAGGNTPLHLASARGFHQTVSLLVTSPLAQLEKVNTDGLTALQVAAESGFVNAVRLLLKAGADPSQTVHYCTTTLHRHPDISILIDHELTRRRQLAA